MLHYTSFYILLLFFVLSGKSIQAQTFGNEWINYDQKYFKLKITQKGIYQLSFDNLKTAGFPTNINPEKYNYSDVVKNKLFS